MILVDTNVVSEFMKDEPDVNVSAWARKYGPSELGICVVTVEEIDRGLGRLPEGRRRRDLKRRWSALLDTFDDLIAVYDVAAAQATAEVLVDAEASGRPMALADAQIAGIALASEFPLATRNVKDFEHAAGLTVINPFDATH